jgi:hypothetical protein
VWLGLVEETYMRLVCEMSCVKHSLQWTISEVGGKSALDEDYSYYSRKRIVTETGDCRALLPFCHFAQRYPRCYHLSHTRVPQRKTFLMLIDAALRLATVWESHSADDIFLRCACNQI